MKRVELLLVLSFLLFVQGYLLENVLPAFVGLAVTIYLTLLRSSFDPRVESARDLDRVMQEGKAATSSLKVRNLSRNRLVVRVKELLPVGFTSENPVFSLSEFEERNIEYSIVPVRGTYSIRGPLLRIYDDRGLFYREAMVNSEVRVEVYPSLDRIKDKVKADENLRIAEAFKKTLLGIKTPEIDTLRRFQEGDEPRHIDWKATARTGELIVRDLVKESEGDVYIILDAGREMRKGIRKSKIDYAITLTIAIAYSLKRHSIGLIVYDDYGVIRVLRASRSPAQLERIVRSLRVPPLKVPLLGLKVSGFSGTGLSGRSAGFARKVIPILKKRASLSSGLLDVVSSLPSDAYLIFISDVTSHTGELVKVLLRLRERYRILLLTPNPILFYDEAELTGEKVVWLYRRYVERVEIIRKMNRIVPTVDVGPSDLVEVVRGVLG